MCRLRGLLTERKELRWRPAGAGAGSTKLPAVLGPPWSLVQPGWGGRLLEASAGASELRFTGYTSGSHHRQTDNGSSFPLLCSLLQLVFPEANPCHPLTGGRTDASFVLRGYIDLKMENKQCLHSPSLSHFTSPSQMPVSFRDFLLALSIPVTSLLPSCLFACSSRPGVGNRSRQWGLGQAGDHALHDRQPPPSLNWTAPKEPGG